jgi:hypothetical protein
MHLKLGRVIVGAIVIQHGVICTIEERIRPFSSEMLRQCAAAIHLDMNKTDEFTMRLACGNLSDIANNDSESIKPTATQFFQMLKQIL